MSAREQCIDNAEDYYGSRFFQFPDIVARKHARYEAVAARVDKGELSVQDAKRQLAQDFAALSREAAERHAIAAHEPHAQAASSAQMMGATAMMLQASQPQPVYQPEPIIMYQPAPVINTNCSEMGALTDCTSD